MSRRPQKKKELPFPMIILTEFKLGTRLYLNKDLIVGFNLSVDNDGRTVVYMMDGRVFDVKENPEQIVDRLSNRYGAGAQHVEEQAQFADTVFRG